MQVIVHGVLFGANCSAPFRMVFPPQMSILKLRRYELINIVFSLRDDSEGLLYKFVDDRNDCQLARFAVRPQMVETRLALGIAPK